MVNVSGGFRNFVRNKKGHIVSRKITHNPMERAIEAVAESIMKKITSIDLDAGSVVEAERIDIFATITESRREQGHHSVKGQSIRKN